MDGQRFDDFARTLVTVTSRRAALRALAGGAVAAAAAALGAGGADADHGVCRHPGIRCRLDGQCCSKRCRGPAGAKRCACGLGATRCVYHADCCGTRYCQAGGTCSPTCQGADCSSSADCCGDHVCSGGQCGGCLPRGTACSGLATPCCFSDCGGFGACLSGRGGRCRANLDCESCYLAGDCAGACKNGVCVHAA